MFNSGCLKGAEWRAGFLKPAKYLANPRFLRFYQTRGGRFHPGGGMVEIIHAVQKMTV
jgi:hypothetical protein